MLNPHLSQSCIRCKKKKIRCDYNDPCTGCLERGLGNECLRLPRKVRVRHPRRRQQSTQLTLRPNESIEGNTMLQSSLQPSISSLHHSNASTSTLSLSSHSYIKEAVNLLGSAGVCSQLLREIYFWRVLSLLHACVHPPILLDILERTFRAAQCTWDTAGEEDIPSKSEIALLLSSMALTFQLTPPTGLGCESYKLVQALGGHDGLKPHQRHKALRDKAFEIFYSLIDSQEVVVGMEEEKERLKVIQTGLSLLLYDRMTEEDREGIFTSTLKAAFALQMHRFVEPFTPDEKGHHREAMVRCWWFLVCRSWLSAATASKLSRAIHPSYFTTRLPAEEADVTLTGKLLIHRKVWTPSRYSIGLIMLAQAVQYSVDLKDCNEGNKSSWHQVQWKVEETFESMTKQLPSSFCVDANDQIVPHEPKDVASAALLRTSMERWLFHQQLFHIYLELQSNGKNTIVSSAMVELAHKILVMREQTSGRCAIVDHMSSNKLAVFKAIVILVKAEMQKGSYLGSFLTRSKLLGEVEAILETLPFDGKHSSHINSLLEQFRHLLFRKTMPTVESSNSSSSSTINTATTTTTTSNNNSTNTTPEHQHGLVSFTNDANYFPISSTSSSSLYTPTITTTTAATAAAPTGVDKIPRAEDFTSIDTATFSQWMDSLPSDAAIGPVFTSSTLFDNNFDLNILDWLDPKL